MNGKTSRDSDFAANRRAHDLIADRYDLKHTEIYNPLEENRLAQVLKELVAATGIPDPMVLDVGAGTGNLSMKFAHYGCHVTALDVSDRSLAVLRSKVGPTARLETLRLESPRFPLPDGSFDIVATYSVLHHIPDYLGAVREMARVLRPGGLIYIDHEANPTSWHPEKNLLAYRTHCRLGIGAHLSLLIRTGELFTADFWKCAWIKLFVNPRFEREGDIHVWPDDHIEWSLVYEIFAEHGITVEQEVDYLGYQPRGGRETDDRYRLVCSDMRMVIGRKRV